MEPGPAPYLLECVEAIYRLGRERAPVALAQLGKRLGLGRAATTERILALQAQGLVRAHDAERITLTPEAELWRWASSASIACWNGSSSTR